MSNTIHHIKSLCQSLLCLNTICRFNISSAETVVFRKNVDNTIADAATWMFMLSYIGLNRLRWMILQLPMRFKHVEIVIKYIVNVSKITARQRLTQISLDKVAAISQTTFSNAFSWMKSFVFRLKFHWSLFLKVQLIISQHWFRYWPGTNRRQAITCANTDPVQWHIYATLRGDGLNFRTTPRH